MAGNAPHQHRGAVTSAAGRALIPSGPDRVYTSRSLRFDEVRAVGFDMDYTLAVYDQDEMDALSIRLTVARLVQRGYPERLIGLDYPTNFAIRGLLVDTQLGNVLKMDRYRYVKRAYHGLVELTRDERRRLYEARRLEPGTARYHWIDTLYGVSEVAVFSRVLADLEKAGDEVDPAKLFNDIRRSIDHAHRSGEVFSHLRRDPGRFFRRDPKLAPMLDRLSQAGKTVFLLTNSPPASADMIMSFLLDDAVATDGRARWQDWFDLVICAAKKPGFFGGSEPFVRADDPSEFVTSLRPGHTYTGGNQLEFERLVGVSGTDVLYVGDHIYGDVLRASVESNWRTMMIVQELPDEMVALHAHREALARIDELDEALHVLHDQLRLEQAVRDGTLPVGAVAQAPRLPGMAEESVADRIAVTERERDRLSDLVEAAFHPYWGSLFKAGSELSLFGAQVDQYAWLYAERATSLLAYSPLHYFRSPHARMAHEA